jgi:adenylate cyclase
VVVSAAVADAVRGRVPFALDDLGERRLKNIARPVRAFRLRAADPAPRPPPPPEVPQAASPAPGPGGPDLALPDRPSLVVLPFQNMSGDPEQEYFTDGMVEEITTALARVRWLFVIARNSAFAYKGRAVDVREVGRGLGVRYVLEGSVRRAGDRVRITGQLVEAETGHHVWADRFDGELADLFDLQDRVAEAVAGAVEPSLRAAEIRRARAKATGNLTAYDLYLRALPRFYALTRDGLAEAERLLRQALAADPGYALARAFLATCLSRQEIGGSRDDAEEAARLAREVLAAEREDPLALAHAAFALGGQEEQAVRAVERALALGAGSADVLCSAAVVFVRACAPDRALDCAARAIRLSPLDPRMPTILAAMAQARIIAGRYEEALATARRAVAETADFGFGLWQITVALALAGRLEEARAAAGEMLRVAPGLGRVRAERHLRSYADQAFARRLVEALRAVGLPE